MFFLLVLFLALPLSVKAVLGWQTVDLNKDGIVDKQDITTILSFWGCPNSVNCPKANKPPQIPVTTTNSPVSTGPPAGVGTGYAACPFGTQLISDEGLAFTKDIATCPAFVFTGNVDMAAQIYPSLKGWQRGLGGGSLQQITNKNDAARVKGIQDDYDFLVYGPESGHQAGDEALRPEESIIKAKQIADQAGKQLLYAPSVEDYETHIQEERAVNGMSLVPLVAPYVDIWGIQLGNKQGLVDSGRTSRADFIAWLANWSAQIKEANPKAKIVVQLGIGTHDPLTKTCLPPPPLSYLFSWRDTMSPYIDGIIIMPAQPCQPCPDNPGIDFPCTTKPENIAMYKEYYQVAKKAVLQVCQK